MNDRTDRDPLLDQRLQALLDDRIGDRRDAGLRSATLDPERRRVLGAYKAVYRVLRSEPESLLPDDFAARVTATARGEAYAGARSGLVTWQLVALACSGGAVLCVASLGLIAADPARLLAVLGGPVGAATLALLFAPLFDRALDRWFAVPTGAR